MCVRVRWQVGSVYDNNVITKLMDVQETTFQQDSKHLRNNAKYVIYDTDGMHQHFHPYTLKLYTRTLAFGNILVAICLTVTEQRKGEIFYKIYFPVNMTCHLEYLQQR